jgi:hypothetical protein
MQDYLLLKHVIGFIHLPLDLISLLYLIVTFLPIIVGISMIKGHNYLLLLVVIPETYCTKFLYVSRLGGIVVSVPSTGPKGCGFEPCQGDAFLMAIKIRSTPVSRMGSKTGRSHVVRFYGM